MRVHRTLLYTGVFLVALGGVVAAGTLGAFDPVALGDALRLWPLAIVAIGIGLVVRRTPAAVPAGIVAALLPGLVIGGAFAVGPRLAGECWAVGSGLERDGAVWKRLEDAMARHHADPRLHVDFGALDLDPEGVCA
jgi:hypothetical protein